MGAHEDGDAADDDAVGLGVAELDRAHHGFVVDLAERQCGQMFGGQRGIIGVEQPGRGGAAGGYAAPPRSGPGAEPPDQSGGGTRSVRRVTFPWRGDGTATGQLASAQTIRPG